MYGDGRDDMYVRAAWDMDPPAVYVDLPAGTGAGEMDIRVTTDSELYLACPSTREPDWARDVTELVLSMVDLPEEVERLREDVVSERVPLPDRIADDPERYTASAAANNGVVTIRFEEDY